MERIKTIGAFGVVGVVMIGLVIMVVWACISEPGVRVGVVGMGGTVLFGTSLFHVLKWFHERKYGEG